jgi:hypothetical protein
VEIIFSKIRGTELFSYVFRWTSAHYHLTSLRLPHCRGQTSR